MKRFALLILFLLITIQIVSADDGLYCLKLKRGNYGFIDIDGNMVIPPVYDQNTKFSNGWAAVSQNGKKFYIDTTGSIVLETPYKTIGPFSDNGLAYYVQGKNELGYINRQGEKVITLFLNDPLGHDFSSGYACIGRFSDGYSQFIDEQGNIAFDLKVVSSTGFEGKYAIVQLKKNERYVKKVIDSTGRIVLLPEGYTYKDDWLFIRGDWIQVMKGNQAVWYNPEIKEFRDYLYTFDSYRIITSEQTSLCGVVDTFGNELIPCEYDSFWEVNATRLLFEKNGQYGLITTDNEILVDAEFEEVLVMDENMIYFYPRNGFNGGYMRAQDGKLFYASDYFGLIE